MTIAFLIYIYFLLLLALEKVVLSAAKEGNTIDAYTVDVTDRKSVYKNADLVKTEIGPVDILINNAGIVCGNTFLDLPDHMIEKTYQVNILSHYWVRYLNKNLQIE